ncbi:hypothetical protein HDU86_000745 [Geranomyces michiganensis]|nr:hypothetical protein HDU86_000745 [Geranomyces michiganensis]
MLSAAARRQPPESTECSSSRDPRASPLSRDIHVDDDQRGVQDADAWRTENFLEAFTTGRFSDMIVISHDHVYRLHRVVLMQSPFFRRLLLEENGVEVSVAEGSLGIEVGGDWRVVREGMDICLRDLYMPASHRSTQITPENVLYVLPAACFLELSTLAAHCVRTVLASLSAHTAVDYADQLERLRLPPGRTAPSPYGPKHAYAKLFGQCLDKLSNAVLGFLCGVINAGLTAEDGAGLKQEMKSAVGGLQADQAQAARQADQLGAQAADDLLSRLPLCWVRRVLESDLLCVPTEYERYELVKRVVAMRVSAPGKPQLDQPAAASDDSILNDICSAEADKNEHDNFQSALDVGEAELNDSDLDASLWSEANTSRASVTSFHSREGSIFSDVVTRNAVATEGVFRLRSYVHSLLGRVVPKGPASAPIIPTSTPPRRVAANRKRKRRSSDLENIYPVDDVCDEDDNDQSISAVEGPSTPHRKAPHNNTREAKINAASCHGCAAHASPATSTSTTPRGSPAGLSRPTPAPAQQRTSIVHTRYGPGSLPHSARDVATNEDTVMAGVFQTAIIYTHMTFPQLELVKADGIVPDAVVLESFWMQAELMSGRARDGAATEAAGGEPRSFGKFRFCVPFRNVGEFFAGKGKGPTEAETAGPSSLAPAASNSGGVLLSNLVVCAGLQYRVLLSVAEDHTSCEDGGDDARHGAPGSPSVARSSRTKTPLLRALLQRNRVGEAKRSRGDGQSSRTGPLLPKPPISYRIFIFWRGDFLRSCGRVGRRTQWDRFVHPVTQCEFNGEGFVNGFAMPEADEEDDLWAVVIIEFK